MAGMFGERLIVRNFGPISNLEIEFRRLTLFIGDQGSGKSTLSKLLTICRDLHWWLLMLENAERNEIEKPFYDFGINEYFMENTYIDYFMEGLSIKYENGSFSIVSDHLSAESIKEFFEFLKKKLGYNQSSVDKDSVSASLIEANGRALLYILAERNLVGNLSGSLASMLSAQVPLPKPMIEYMSMFERAKNEYPTYNIPFFNVRFVKKNGRERIELLGKDKDLPLSACSSGLQSAIPMLMVIDYAINTNSFNSFVIEEPEQNLFPKNQFEMLGFFTSKLWYSQRMQFIITTHSPYMLSSLNVLMLAYKLHHIEEVREETEKIIAPGFTVSPDDVAVYSLDPNSEEYCKSLMSEKTGLVSVNELDSVSEIIGDDFDRLYDLYRQVNRKK